MTEDRQIFPRWELIRQESWEQEIKSSRFKIQGAGRNADYLDVAYARQQRHGSRYH